MSERNQKIQEALREAAAQFLSRESNRTTLITVTRVELSESNKSATVYVSVYPETGEEEAVAFANRNRSEFAKYFETRVRGVRTPHITFVVDAGEKNRRRLDELS